MKHVLLLYLIFNCTVCFANISHEDFMMKFESTAFKDGEPIPKKYTCEGTDVSPPLKIHNIPSEAKSLVLIVDDPDAPMGVFDHWIAWNIPPQTTSLPEGAQVPNQGKNGFGDSRYRGPCPPPGKPHRYYFKLYALDTILSLPDSSSKTQVEKAMKGHVLEETKFHGTYKR